jgi:addiction module HigA family antidote
MAKSKKPLAPIHPGEVLREELLVPLGISANRLARDLRVPVTRISEIVKERCGITADTALRLGRYFGMTARFWLNLQATYDLELAARGASANVDREVLPRSAA